jgi:hypothetical protein
MRCGVSSCSSLHVVVVFAKATHSDDAAVRSALWLTVRKGHELNNKVSALPDYLEARPKGSFSTLLCVQQQVAWERYPRLAFP